MPGDLNEGLVFGQLTKDEQESFTGSPMPELKEFCAGFELYKWTQYPLVSASGRITSFWSPWNGFPWNKFSVPGFKELRFRYQNRDGEVGRPQEFMRARSAVTQQWNSMESILKATLIKNVWGFVGVCRSQRVSKDPAKPDEHENVVFIGGAYQICIPGLTVQHIRKL